MSIVRDIPKERRNFVAKTVVSLLISLLVLLSLNFNFNTFSGKVGNIIAYISIVLGWFLIYPLFLRRYYSSIVEKYPPKPIKFWIKFVTSILPASIISVLIIIFFVIFNGFVFGMILSLRKEFDPKMISGFISLLIYIVFYCFTVIDFIYLLTKKEPPKIIKICEETIRQNIFTYLIILITIASLATDFIINLF